MTYRRVLRGSPILPIREPSVSFPVAVSTFSGSVIQRAMSAPDHSFSNVAPHHAVGLPVEDVGEMTVEEAELPEVALDRNRHIIPRWLLHRHPHDRTCPLPDPLAPGVNSGHHHSHPIQLSGAAASSPALIQNQRPSKLNGSQSSHQRRTLTRQPTEPLDEGNPCFTGDTTRAISSFADPRSAWGPSDDPQAPRRDLRPFHSELAVGSQESSCWFGGTGSTTVNTKLKDHIFSTILRRFHRRYKPRWLKDSHVEDEEEATAQQGGELPASPRPRSTPRSQYAGSVERPKERENKCCTSVTIRKVRSDSEMGHDGQNNSFDVDYDKLDDFFGTERSNLALDGKDGIQPLLTRRRSRSRSVDSPSVYLSSPQLLNQPIPSNKSSHSVPRQHHFILMEDLTGRLKRSCVLDLKMGTRQYGMDAILSKKRSQRKKCDRTTSRPLGVRVCGMQVRTYPTNCSNYPRRLIHTGMEPRHTILRYPE